MIQYDIFIYTDDLVEKSIKIIKIKILIIN